jgi:CheY-like chemotaxis protein
MVHNPPQGEKQLYSDVKTILLVEDDESIGEVLQQVIKQETSYFVIYAVNAFDALQLVKKIKPNLFILDYQLPNMNGLILYDQLHAMPELANVPALMMSALLPRAELATRDIMGMSKPIELDDFLLAIEKLISR